MRFLKKKIAKAMELSLKKSNLQEVSRNSKDKMIRSTLSFSPSLSPNLEKEQRKFKTPEKIRSSKNLVKNFGKAICSFAASEIAVPYLEFILQKESITLESFVDFVLNIKETIDSIQAMHAILTKNDKDSESLQAFKRVFRGIGEIFIKYFSVNWIFHGRIAHKEAHLKFRFKMLRRIQRPEMFIYTIK